jgi:hypothetical protein
MIWDSNNSKAGEMKRLWPDPKYQRSIFLEGLKKTEKYLGQDCQYPSLNSNGTFRKQALSVTDVEALLSLNFDETVL